MNRPFTPKFLKKYDNYLLLNNPELYSTRFHWIVYYCLLAYIIIAGVFCILPNDNRSDSPIGIWISFSIIISILGIVTWLIYLLRFNVFKRFGNISGLNRLGVFVLYLLSTALIVFFTFIPPIVETFKANIAYKDAEIVNDINAFNKLICQIEVDSFPKYWNSDTFIIDKTIIEKKDPAPTDSYDEASVEMEVVAPKNVGNVKFGNYPISTGEMQQKIKYADSLLKFNDSTYAFFKCPKFVSIEVYDVEKLEGVLLNDLNLYKQVILKNETVNKETVMNKIINLVEKYSYEDGKTHLYKAAKYYAEDTTYRARFEKRYHTSIIERNLRNIVSRKIRWRSINDFIIYGRVLYYLALGLSLLLFIFRHSTIKTFFLSLLTALVLFILSSIFIAVYNESFGSNILCILLLYTFVFGLISCVSFTIKTRNIIVGIAINLFTALIYFLPLITVVYYYTLVVEPRNPIALEAFNATKWQAIIIAEILCPILFLTLITTFIYKLNRRWYALPQE